MGKGGGEGRWGREVGKEGVEGRWGRKVGKGGERGRWGGRELGRREVDTQTDGQVETHRRTDR